MQTIRARKNDIQARFGGAGFHNSEAELYPRMSDTLFNQCIGKIFRELSPGFSRMWGGAPTWSREEMDRFAEYCRKMHCVTDTEIYLTGNTRRYETEEEKQEYARQVADRLCYLIEEKGIRNIHYYCMSNELSIESWGNLFFELPVFRDYHTHLYREFRRRNLPVQLLATDASPYERWESIEWAANNGMVPISGVFGGHHYVNDFEPQDLDFYHIFQKHVDKVVRFLQPHERRFILGEFGLAQDMRIINGVKMDVCKYFYDGQEAYSALQIVEMALAALNAGVYAMALWTFTDYPNPTGINSRYNKWGMTRWDGDDHSPRDWLYAYGLLAKYFRRESKPLSMETGDYLLRSGGVVNDDRSFSIAIVNRHEEQTGISLTLEGLSSHKPLRLYVYDSANVPRNPFGDLQGYTEELPIAGQEVRFCIPGNSVAMLTSDYEVHTPQAVTGIRMEERRVCWDPSPEDCHCYYRVYRGESADFVPALSNQVASTIATSYDVPEGEGGYYKIRSVDRWGNC